MACVQIRHHFSPNINLFQLHAIQIKYLAEAGRTSERQRKVRRAGNKYRREGAKAHGKSGVCVAIL